MTPSQELELKQLVLDRDMKMQGLNRKQTAITAKKYAENNQIDNFDCSYHWLQNFRRRCSLSFRIAEGIVIPLYKLEEAKLKGLDPARYLITKMVEESEEFLIRSWELFAQLSYSYVVVVDEVSCVFDPRKKTILTLPSRFKHHPKYLTSSYARRAVTVLSCFTLYRLVLMVVIFKAGKFAPYYASETLLVVQSESGWQTSETYCFILSDLKKKQILGIIHDRAPAHISEKSHRYLNRLHLLSSLIPAECTRYLSPLDVSLNHPLKTFLTDSEAELTLDHPEIYLEFSAAEHRNAFITAVDNFRFVYNLDRSIANGFLATGLVPSERIITFEYDFKIDVKELFCKSHSIFCLCCVCILFVTHLLFLFCFDCSVLV